MHRLRRLHQHADEGRHPAHGEREHHQQQAGADCGQRAGQDAEPEDEAETERHGDRDQVAHVVAEDRAGQRRRAGDRQGAEPVEHASGDVLAQHHAGAEGGERHRQHHDARQRVLQVLVRAPGELPAEHVGEQDQVHDRLQQQPEHVLRVRPDLEHAPPGQRERVPQAGHRAEPPGWHKGCTGHRALLLSFFCRPPAGTSVSSGAVSSAR